MSGLSPERREELAGLLLRHGHAEWDEFDGQVVADAIAPLIAGWLAEEFRRGGRAGREAGLLAGAAEVRARVEAVIKERGYAYRDAPRATPIIRAFTEELRAALNGGE